jgi:hypothetical protein
MRRGRISATFESLDHTGCGQLAPPSRHRCRAAASARLPVTVSAGMKGRAGDKFKDPLGVEFNAETARSGAHRPIVNPLTSQRRSC